MPDLDVVETIDGRRANPRSALLPTESEALSAAPAFTALGLPGVAQQLHRRLHTNTVYTAYEIRQLTARHIVDALATAGFTEAFRPDERVLSRADVLALLGALERLPGKVSNVDGIGGVVINRNRRANHCWCLSHRLQAAEIEGLGDGSREQKMRHLCDRKTARTMKLIEGKDRGGSSSGCFSRTTTRKGVHAPQLTRFEQRARHSGCRTRTWVARWLPGESGEIRACVAVQRLDPQARDHAPHRGAVDQGQQHSVPGTGHPGVGPLGVHPAATPVSGGDLDRPVPLRPSCSPPLSSGSPSGSTSRSGRRPRTANRRCSRGPPPRSRPPHAPRRSSGRGCGPRSWDDAR